MCFARLRRVSVQIIDHNSGVTAYPQHDVNTFLEVSEDRNSIALPEEKVFKNIAVCRYSKSSSTSY
jgi:hypothetical protein